MSSSSKQKVITYAEAVRTLNTDDVQADLDSACEQMAVSVVELSSKFNVVANMLHTTNLQGPPTAFRIQWNVLCKVKTTLFLFISIY